ncbi:MAG: Ig-like domain-containing protein [Christensenellaceae bacterium]|nr:Ig-like domain-containing protein [Christensenellaceae bacterium]MDD6927521.1 Ig-like domain-containing protein [bacterium]
MKKTTSVILFFILCVCAVFSLFNVTKTFASEGAVRVVKNNAAVSGVDPVNVVPNGKTGTSVHLIKPDWKPVGRKLELSHMDKDKITLEMWIHISDLGSLSVGPFLPGNVGFTIEDNEDTARYFCYWLQYEDVVNWVDGWNHVSIRFSLLDKDTYRRGWDRINLSSMTFKMYAPMLEDLYLHDVFIKETEQTKANVLISSQPIAFPAKGISLSSSSLKIKTGATALLEPSIKPKSSQNTETVDWSTSDEFVAQVDENGLVKGISEGSCTVTATVRGRNLSAKAKVTVSDEIKVNPLNTITPDINSSLREGAFDIDEKHLISPAGDGSITRFGNFSGQTAGGLSNFSISSFELENTVIEFNLLIMNKGDFIGAGNPDSDEKNGYFGVGEPISTGLWSTNHIMYKIDETLWNKLYEGWNRVRIKVSAMTKTGNPNLSNLSFLLFQQHANYSQRANLGINGLKIYEAEQTEDVIVDEQIKLVPAESVTIDAPSELFVGKTYKLSAEIKPDNATFKDFASFSSSNEKVLKIRSDGTVIAVSEGEATISLDLFGNDERYEKTIRVINKNIHLVSLNFSEKSFKTKINAVIELKPILSPADTTEYEICFVSDNHAVACVDENGKLTAVGTGKAKITAYSAANPEIKDVIEITVTKDGGCASTVQTDAYAVISLALYFTAFIAARKTKEKNNAQ